MEQQSVTPPIAQQAAKGSGRKLIPTAHPIVDENFER